MHLVISPDLSLVTRVKNDAFAQDLTWKVAQYPTRARDNSRGISSATSRSFSIDGFIDLSRDNSREISIATLHYTSINKPSDHLIANSINGPRPKGAILDLCHQVKSAKRVDVHDAFLTGKIFRSREDKFSGLERKNFPPNNIQRRKSRELR